LQIPEKEPIVADNRLNVLVICGSSRKLSYNAALTRALPPLAPDGMVLKTAPSTDKLPIYNNDDEDATGFPAEAVAWADAIRAADGVLFVSPEYNWGVPGGLKDAIDWASRMKDVPFKGKAVAIQSCARGPMGGARMQYQMRLCMTSVDAFIFGKPEVIVSFAPKKFDEATLELTDQPTKDIIKLQLAGFEKFIRRLNGKS
jgi:chromate reductase, NAD(P)H dehydrogenase (quinone)